jgi:hypothetical protein
VVAGSGARVKISDVRLVRDFNTGRLIATYQVTKAQRRDTRSRFIDEPIGEYDAAIIGDTPIPSRLEKVDL